MTKSPLQEIADTLATDFRQAVIDAELTDVETIEKITQEFNQAWHDFDVRDKVLNTKAEEAVRTLKEVCDLRDGNTATFARRTEAIRQQLAQFRETKLSEAEPFPPKPMPLKIVDSK